MSLAIPPAGGARFGAMPKGPPSPAKPEGASGAADSSAAGFAADVLSPRTVEPSVPAAPRKRVQWAPTGSLAEIREYVIEEKKRHDGPAPAGFKDQYAHDVEREKQTLLQQRSHQLDLLDLMRPSHIPAPDADASAAEGGLQPTLAWVTPPLLDESLWPAFKGDASTEREVQRQRRSLVPETGGGLGELSEAPTEPGPEDRAPKREDDSLTPLIPLERVAPPAAEAQGACSGATLEAVGGGACGGNGGSLSGLGAMEGAGGNMGQQQAMQLMSGGGMMGQHQAMQLMSGGGAMGGNHMGGGMMGGGMMNMGGNMGGNMMNGVNGVNGLNGLGGMPGMQAQSQQGGGGSNLTEKIFLQMMLQGNKPGGGGGFASQPQQGFGNNGFDASRRDPSMHPKFRTKPCRYFASSGGCKNGDRCTFLHVEMSSEQFAREFGHDGMHGGGQFGNGGGMHGGGQFGNGGGSRPGPPNPMPNGRLPGLGGPLNNLKPWMP